MNRVSKSFLLILATAILLLPLAFAEDNATGTTVLNGLNKDNTGNALDGSWDSTIVKGTDVSSSDTTGQVVTQLGKAAEADAAGVKKDIINLKDQMVKQPTGGLSKDMRATRSQLLKDADRAIADKSAGSWCSKIGKVLDVINVVAVGAQAAGYAAEGDMNGASGAVVSEGTKRVATAAGAFLGGPIPYAGPIFGAAKAEELHDATTKKLIDKNVDIARNSDARDKMQGTGAAPVQIMTESGGTRTLASDLYVEPGTGNIKQRTPDQQKAYRDQISEDIRSQEKAPPSTKPLDIAMDKLKRGEITQAQFDQELSAVNNPHNRNRILAVDEEEPAKGDQGHGDRSDAGPAIEDPNPDPALVKEAQNITPKQMRAEISYEWDYNKQEFRDMQYAKVILTFWNVGSLVPGYGVAKVSVTNTSKVSKVSETLTGSGTFSGGPNGVFRLTVGGKRVSGKIKGAYGVSYEGHQGFVDNPVGFLEWKTGY